MSSEEVIKHLKVGDIVIFCAKFSGVERAKAESITTVESIGKVTEITDKCITLTSEKRCDISGVESFNSLHRFYFKHWDIDSIAILTLFKYAGK